ncbi:MAG: methyltransferase [Holophagales bacterium]|nr:methyltransferase [Holophagales bacterium]MYD23077.1 methyltransferase [Holophagales bacterium]MYI34358.1 methyltransferase [Holophagales bacterium]
MTLGDQGPNRVHDTFKRIVRLIPEGRVATYGQIAELANRPRNARQVGYTLARLEDESVPWHRVVNVRGSISERGVDPLESVERQRFLLQEEGVVFDRRGRIDLERFGWRP